MSFITFQQAKARGIIPWTNPIIEFSNYRVYNDKYPVSQLHYLFVPVTSAPAQVANVLEQAYRYGLQLVDDIDTNFTGFNVGINSGVSSGQTIMYPHVHLIMRTDGDCEDPRGGVRGVIPERQKY